MNLSVGSIMKPTKFIAVLDAAQNGHFRNDDQLSTLTFSCGLNFTARDYLLKSTNPVMAERPDILRIGTYTE